MENSYLFFSSEHRVYLDWQEIFRLKFILMFTKNHLLDTLGTNVLEVEVKDACNYGLIEAELHGATFISLIDTFARLYTRFIVPTNSINTPCTLRYTVVCKSLASLTMKIESVTLENASTTHIRGIVRDLRFTDFSKIIIAIYKAITWISSCTESLNIWNQNFQLITILEVTAIIENFSWNLFS